MIRKTLSKELDPEMRSEPGLSLTNRWIVFLILISIFLGVAETEVLLTAGNDRLFAAAHLLLFVIFACEYAARLYAAPENPRYRTSLSYARTLSAMLDLLVLLSFVMPFFGLEATLLRMFRAARLVRLARLGRYSVAMQMIYHAVAQRRYELGVSVAVAFGLMLLSSTALYFVERELQPEAFGSIPRAMWWSVATLTTVGYGDIVPVSALGKAAAALTAITGIGIIALPTGILAGAFGEALQNLRASERRDD